MTQNPPRRQRYGPDASARVQAVVPQWSTSSSMQALQNLMDVTDSVTVAIARRAGLSTIELHAARLLMRESQGPVQISKELGITSAAASGVVDRLCERGFTARQTHPTDGRRTVVMLTDEGRMALVKAMTPMFEGLSHIDGALSARDRDVVARYLDDVVGAVQTLFR